MLLDVATATAIEKVKCARIFSAFISYSHADHEFAQWLHDALTARGIKCWLDKKQLLAGDRIHTKVESAIQERDKILLCASSASLTSWWVDNELNSVIIKEQALWKQTGEETLALIPLNLDGFMFTDVWKSGWRSQIVSRLAPDFTKWTNERSWECNDALASLIRALIIDTTTVGSPFSEV
jgi:TIR domain